MSAASVKHLDPTRVELEIPISPEELEAARERAFRKLVKNVKIPGFRPGKAPRKVFEAQYGSGVITERAMEEVVPQAYERALMENGLDPLDRPELELLPNDGDPQRLQLRATLNIRPHIELKDYVGMPVSLPNSTATEEQFEREMEALRRAHITLVPVDRPLALGDIPTLDFEGKIDGVPCEGWAATNESFELAEHEFMREFVAGLIGMKAGETKDINVSFPEDFEHQSVAGKTVCFTVTVHDNKVGELPPLDDDFAKRFGPEMTLENLSKELRARLDAEVLRIARENAKEPLLDHLADAHEFPLPQSWLDRELESILREMQGQAEKKGQKWEEHLNELGKTEDAVREEALIQSRRRVKLTLLIQAIAKAEKIDATQEDFQAEFNALAQYFRQPMDALVERLRPNMGAIRENIIRSKTIEFLLDRAAITSPAEGA